MAPPGRNNYAFKAFKDVHYREYSTLNTPYMKKLLTLSFLCISFFFMYSCHKDSGSPAGPAPIKVDLSSKTTCSVTGYVIDESGDGIPFAAIIAGDKKATTDEFGYFSITNVSLPETAGLIKVSSNAYFSGYRSFIPQKDKTTFVRIGLLKKKDIGTVNAVAGGEASTAEGGKISLPASGVVNATGGAAYTGEVHINARWIDPSKAADPQQGMPGDGRGMDDKGFLKALNSYGILAVELTGNAGQPLQIAPGKSAGVIIPISSALSASAPASIALWSFNDSLGLWKQEGTATKSGNTYVGTTAHFSFWDGATGADLVNFKARVVDASAHPLVNVPVIIDIAGLPQNGGYGTFAYTDADGNVSGAVLANRSLVFQVMSTCAIAAYSQPFTTTSADVDLGQVTGNMGQRIVTLSGTVKNCDNSPVTNGYIQTYDHGFYNRIPIVNGAFSFTGLACTNQEASIVAIDNITHQQSLPKTVTLSAGVNDLGNITACGTSTMGSISYTYDNVTTNITEPSDTVGGYFLRPVPDTATNRWTQIVVLSGNPNLSQRMAFQFDGGNGIGAGHHVSDVFSTAFPSSRGYWPVPITVNISEYGDIGGFISGSFSSNMLDFVDNSLHTLSCTFRVRRYN